VRFGDCMFFVSTQMKSNTKRLDCRYPCLSRSLPAFFIVGSAPLRGCVHRPRSRRAQGQVSDCSYKLRRLVEKTRHALPVCPFLMSPNEGVRIHLRPTIRSAPSSFAVHLLLGEKITMRRVRVCLPNPKSASRK